MGITGHIFFLKVYYESMQILTSKRNLMVYVLLLIGVISLSGLLVFIIKEIFTIPQVTVESTPDEQPTGVLYASMAKADAPLGILSYTFGRASSTFEVGISFPSATVMQFETSNVGIAFMVFSPLAPDPVTQKRESNIIEVGKTDKDIDYVLPASNTLIGIRNLNYSEANKLLAFTAKELSTSSTASIESADAWGVYTVDPATHVVEKIGSGIGGSWSPDGASLVYLGKDGIKQYMLENKTTNNVTADRVFGSMIIETNMNMDVSPNGKLVAISSPNDSLLTMLTVTSWSPLTLASVDAFPSIKKVGATFYWPTFSFDNQFIAVQIADAGQEGMQINPRIEIFRLSDMHVVSKIPIGDFDFGRAFVDSWSMQ